MRKVICINEGWEFTKQGETVTVDLPHTWNGIDGQNARDYYRGKCVYSKEIPQYSGKVFLEINGANLFTQVKVNGFPAASHNNGYSMFRCDITDLLTEESNLLEISVDNRSNDELYPQTADFTFYGGIYRDVNIICEVAPAHFALLDKGRNGVFITPKTDGRVYVKSIVEGIPGGETKEFTVTDAEGNTVAEFSCPVTEREVCGKIEEPRLWNGREDPYLYTLTARLVKNGEVTDEVTQRFGLRECRFDSEKGFFLNGKPLKLRGVARHQDRENIGNALTLKEHSEDIDLICELGANSLRLAHYQQSEDFYSLCDEKGLLVWAEIPVISKFSSKKQPQARLMLKELIKQNYNHPSIFCWGIENEISIASISPSLSSGIGELNDIAHKLDATRPTACAQVAFCSENSKLNRITDILGYNHYFGWYVKTADEISRWLDNFHALNPDIKLCLSEYGAEANIALHSAEPAQGDYSEEYQCVFHEKYLKAINERKWLWGSYVWNMFDFGSASRNEGGTKGRNNKGLVTIDRKTKKDSFFLYKAHWSDEKFVHICGERYVNRPVGACKIKVYSNCGHIELTVNGAKQELDGDKIFVFDAGIQPGENIITAASGDISHSITLCGTDAPDASYSLGEGQQSFVRNWFEPSGDPDPSRLSLNDTLGEIANNSEVVGLMENHLGKVIKIPAAAGKISVKPIASLLSKVPRGKELVDFANQYLQTIKKD